MYVGTYYYYSVLLYQLVRPWLSITHSTILNSDTHISSRVRVNCVVRDQNFVAVYRIQ